MLIVVISLALILGSVISRRVQARMLASWNQQVDFLLERISDAALPALNSGDPDQSSEFVDAAISLKGIGMIAFFDRAGNLGQFRSSLGNERQLEEVLRVCGSRNIDAVLDSGLVPSSHSLYSTPVAERRVGKPTRIRGTLLMGLDEGGRQARMESLDHRIWLLTGLGGLISAGLMMLLTSQLVSPLRRMTIRTYQIERDRGSHLATLQRGDEVGVLAGRLDAMAETVRQSEQLLRIQNARLEKMVASRSRDLREASQKLELANQRKDAFLSCISHEFRTPLSILRAWAELMAQAPEDPESGKEGLPMMKDAACELEGAARNLILLLELESGARTLATKRLECSECLDEVVRSIREQRPDRTVLVHRDKATGSRGGVVGSRSRFPASDRVAPQRHPSLTGRQRGRCHRLPQRSGGPFPDRERRPLHPRRVL